MIACDYCFFNGADQNEVDTHANAVHKDGNGDLITSSVVDKTPHTPTSEEVQAAIMLAVSQAMEFGMKTLIKMAAQNILLGITQAGQTATVMDKCSGIILSMQTGSLYNAIAEAKAIPSDQYDGTFVTGERLLAFVNSVEDYLGITHSTQWW